MAEEFSISICVPAFNEERNLREAVEDLLQTLSTSVQKLDIIIVDDGSTDSTPRLADWLAKEYHQVRAIHHIKKMGIGVSYRDALAIAQGDYFTWFPGDHENSAQEFILCMPHLRKDTVVTCYHRWQDPRSSFRRFISQSYTYFLNKLFHLNLKYYNGLTVFPTSVLRSLSLAANGFLFTAENLIKAIKKSYRIVELPAPLRGRTFGRSNALTFSSAKQTARDIFRILQTRA
jgi:glycosyltransferase involved in cell wall biosynthesis